MKKTNKKKFISVLIKHLNEDRDSPLYGKINRDLKLFLFELIFELMTNDDNLDIGFEYLYELYKKKDNLFKNILPLLKQQLFIYEKLLNLNILDKDILYFIFLNLDTSLNNSNLDVPFKLNKIIDFNNLSKEEIYNTFLN